MFMLVKMVLSSMWSSNKVLGVVNMFDYEAIEMPFYVCLIIPRFIESYNCAESNDPNQ